MVFFNKFGLVGLVWFVKIECLGGELNGIIVMFVLFRIFVDMCWVFIRLL